MPTISGTAGNDTLNGTAGDDVINGLAGDDTLNGDDGNDVLAGGDGNDTIDGGAGIDTISFAAATQGVRPSLSVTWPYYAGEGYNDQIINVENIIGSDFDDSLSGSDFANDISGGAGNDLIAGGKGNDTLTGGSGNDYFFHYAGDGKDTITDLAAGDEIVFDGYSTYQSVTQQGDDVVIVFSATDQVTVLNAEVAAIEEFLPHASVFSQPPSTIIPLLPERPAEVTATATVVLNGSPTVTITADQVYHGVEIDPTFGPYGSYFRAGWGSPLVFTSHEFMFDWRLINQGTIWNSSAKYHVNSVWADSLTNSGTIVAEVGPFDPPGMASMQYFTARAVVVSGPTSNAGLANPALDNSGQIYAIADHGNAFGVYSEAAYSGFINSGLIAAHATYGSDHSQSGGAYGIWMQNGGSFINSADGEILVEGDRAAFGVYQGRGAISGSGPEILNRGLIHAVVGPDSARPSVGIFAVNLPTELMRIVNSGTIKADIAIYCPSNPPDTFTSSTIINAQSVTNEAGGLIEGKIQLELGDDVLVNAGTIRGTVDMGGNDDLVDNSAGIIEGRVLLAAGDDEFLGGSSADHASGGDGYDQLSGGANADLLEGNFGNDVLDGGAGNDGMYGGNGHDILRTSGGDVARGNYGNDRIEAGDYKFAKIDGGEGYDIWVLPTGARALNLATVAATGRVLGIEEIDLRGSQTLVVDAAAVAAVSGANSLHLRGGGSNSVYLAGTWTILGTVVRIGVTYTVYQSGESLVAIESGLQVTVGVAPPAAGGLDAVAGGTAAPAPSPDAESNIYWTSSYPVLANLEISEDDIWKSTDGATVLSFAYQPIGGQPYDAPNIVSFGQIINDVGVGVLAVAVGGLGDTMQFESFSNFGTIQVETSGATTDAYAFLGGGRGVLINDGDIVAVALGSGDATGVATWDGDLDAKSVTNNATGYIGAFSTSGWAVGIYGANAPGVENDGLVEAFGGAGAIAIDLANASSGRVVNHGEIYAAVTGDSGNASIGVAFYDGGRLENGGILAADIAIMDLAAYGLPLEVINSGEIYGAILVTPFSGDTKSGMLRITNSGLIAGDILVDQEIMPSVVATQWNGQTVVANDVVINSGIIEGIVSLAGGNDIYDGTGGELIGLVDAGAGNDIVIGWFDDDEFYGGDGNDTLTGNGGDDYVEGGAGNDVMSGGAGFDTASYAEAASGVTVSLSTTAAQNTGGAGTDTLSGFEDLAGSEFADLLRGSNAGNYLFGLGGADKLYGYDGDDVVEGGSGDDYLYGLIGNDSLIGGAGYDRMYGGVGDDTYHAHDADDYAYENAGEGYDKVIASIDHQLRAEIEELVLTGAATIGKGNGADNAITGTDNANKLYGYGGNDGLYGGGGDDYLFGEAGNDTLMGGTGYDRMYGGAGDDRYIVGDGTDYAYENAGEGTDRVVATINHVLRANIEQLELAGSADLRGYGNASANLLIGNSGNNLLYGRDGNDRLEGNAGNDILYGENGNDALEAGAAQDRFYGGAGADDFIFDDGDFGGLTSGTADRIHDFSQAQADQLRLSAVDANSSLAGDQAFAFIGTAAFTGVAGQLRYQQINGNTYVQGDTDGDGDADFWIRLDGLHSLQSSDFIV